MQSNGYRAVVLCVSDADIAQDSPKYDHVHLGRGVLDADADDRKESTLASRRCELMVRVVRKIALSIRSSIALGSWLMILLHGVYRTF